MIHWSWLIVAAGLGGICGLLVCALIVSASQADERIEEMMRKK